MTQRQLRTGFATRSADQKSSGTAHKDSLFWHEDVVGMNFIPGPQATPGGLIEVGLRDTADLPSYGKVQTFLHRKAKSEGGTLPGSKQYPNDGQHVSLIGDHGVMNLAVVAAKTLPKTNPAQEPLGKSLRNAKAHVDARSQTTEDKPARMAAAMQQMKHYILHFFVIGPADADPKTGMFDSQGESSPKSGFVPIALEGVPMQELEEMKLAAHKRELGQAQHAKTRQQ